MTDQPPDEVPPGPPLTPPSPPQAYPTQPYPQAYPTQPYGAPPYPVQPPRPADVGPPSRTMARWALGLAIVPCCGISTLVGIGLGIAVLVRSRTGRDHGRVMAWFAVGIGAAWLVVGLVAAAFAIASEIADNADRDSTGRITQRGELSVLDVRVGDCIDYPALAAGNGESDDTTVTGVPCDEPHQFEAYSSFPLTTDDFPGEDQASRLAARGCFARFKDFVGTPYRRSELEPYILYPTAATWRLADDRTVVCLVGVPGHRTTGSLEDSRR